MILTLTAGLATAFIFGFIALRLRLSPIVGYLLAGILIGPYTPGFVADRNIASELAEIGIVLLMFGVGLHFHVRDLLAVRSVAITGALVQSAAATALGAALGRGFGWSWSGALVFGMALSVASTVVLTRVLIENRHLHTSAGRVAIGWLVVEDLFTVLALVLLPTLVQSSGNESVNIVVTLLWTLLKVALFVGIVLILGERIIVRILYEVERTHSRELFTLAVLVLALGIALGSAEVFGASMALGAFVAGMIVGQSEFSFRAASDALPMRDAFAVLFFVSTGMLFDPRQLAQAPLLLAGALGIVLLAKPAAAFVIVVILGYGSKMALMIAAALAQIGEFSLVLATLGAQLNILPDAATNALVAASIVSIMSNPFIYQLADPVERALASRPKLWRLLNRRAKPKLYEAEPASVSPRAIIVGYGPIGKTLARLLRAGGIEPVVIETNLETSRRAREDGCAVVYGNAEDHDVLETAGIGTAQALAISGPGREQSAEIIKIARRLNSSVQVLARTEYLLEEAEMRKAGAHEVFSGEGEVALAMTEYVLRRLGSSEDEIGRERQRVRDEFFRIPTD